MGAISVSLLTSHTSLLPDFCAFIHPGYPVIKKIKFGAKPA